MQNSWKSIETSVTALLFFLCLSFDVKAADTALVAALKRQNVTFASLVDAARAAQYVLIGEDHGIAESAQFDGALFTDLAAHGFKAMVIENGPTASEAIALKLRQSDPQFALSALVRDYPDTVAFYNWQENAVLLERVAQAGGKDFVFWGIDQELMGAAKLLLEQILLEPIDPAARVTVELLIAEERDAYFKAAASGNPTCHLMMTANLDELRALRLLLSGRALSLLDGLIESREIYAKNGSSSPDVQSSSNVQRNLLMKRTLAARLHHAPDGRLLVQIGASHAYKGINNLGNHEIGNYLAEKAEGDGHQSLHIMVLPASGIQARFAGTARAFANTPVGLYTDGFRPMVEAARDRTSPALFDLRALRVQAHALGDGNVQVERILQGYDFAVVLNDVHPMHALP